MPASYSQRTNLLRSVEQFSIEDGQLVRRMARGREMRWPLAGLRQAMLSRQLIGGSAGRLMLQLSFQRQRGVVLTSHSVQGLGRFEDQTAEFKAFSRVLLQQGLVAAPQARLARAGQINVSALWWAIGAMACGALVVAGSAMASGATALGLDLGARLVFLMLLISAALPWVDRSGATRLEPDALLAD